MITCQWPLISSGHSTLLFFHNFSLAQTPQHPLRFTTTPGPWLWSWAYKRVKRFHSFQSQHLPRRGLHPLLPQPPTLLYKPSSLGYSWHRQTLASAKEIHPPQPLNSSQNTTSSLLPTVEFLEMIKFLFHQCLSPQVSPTASLRCAYSVTQVTCDLHVVKSKVIVQSHPSDAPWKSRLTDHPASQNAIIPWPWWHTARSPCVSSVVQAGTRRLSYICRVAKTEDAYEQLQGSHSGQRSA